MPRQNADQAAAEVKKHATSAGESRVVEWGARAGYVASGILHLLIARIALGLAMEGSSGNADQSGAFQQLMSNTWGKVLMVAMAVGLVLLAVWQLTEAIRANEWKDRIKPIGKIGAYLSLAAPAITLLTTHKADSAGQTEEVSTGVLAMPGGPILVALAGAVLFGVGAYHVYKGATRKFREDLVQHPGTPAIVTGVVGYIAKGIALAVAGGLIVTAGLSGDTDKARGLDGAFRAILQAPFGQALVIGMAVGFVFFAAYCVVRARYGKV